jgi:hypothetical protein
MGIGCFGRGRCGTGRGACRGACYGGGFEKFVIGMRELAVAAVVANFAGKDAAHSGLQLTCTPRLVEESEGEIALAVADHHLEDGTALGAHGALVDATHLRDNRDVLVDRQLAQRCQLAAAGVAPGIVAEQVANGTELEALLQGCRRAPSQHRAEFGVKRGSHCSSVLARRSVCWQLSRSARKREGRPRRGKNREPRRTHAGRPHRR